jgi:hypothetical protein
VPPKNKTKKKDNVLKTWSPAGGSNHEGFDLNQWINPLMDSQFDGIRGRWWKQGNGPWLEEVGHWGVPLSLDSSLSGSLLPGLHAAAMFSSQAHSNGVGQPWTENSETMSQNKPFLLLLSQQFVAAMKK